MKIFDKEKVMQNGSRIDQVLAERDILKKIAGLGSNDIFAAKDEESKVEFPRVLNRLV